MTEDHLTQGILTVLVDASNEGAVVFDVTFIGTIPEFDPVAYTSTTPFKSMSINDTA